MSFEDSNLIPSPFIELVAPLSAADKVVLDGWLGVAKQLRPVLFVGAGMSFNAEPIPGWPQRVPREQRSIAPRCLSWKELIGRFRSEMHEADKHEQDYLKVAEYFERTHGRHRLHMMVQESVPDHLLLPGEPHREIVKTDWEAILTTNYDTLIEKAYQESWRRGDAHVICRDIDLARPKRADAACEIIHLHGIISDPESIIITSEDYRKYKDLHPGLLVKMQQLFVQRPVLIIGFSLDDPNFYAINGWVGDLLGPNRPPVICIQHQTSSPSRQTYCQGQGIQLITLSKERPLKQSLTALLCYVSNKLAQSDSPEQLILYYRLRGKLIENYIENARDQEAAMQGLEYVLNLFPQHLNSGRQERKEAWEAFAKWIADQHSKDVLWQRLSTASTEEDYLEHKRIYEELGKDFQIKAPDEYCPAHPIEHLLALIADKKIATRWLYLGIIHVGIPIKFLGRHDSNLLNIIQKEEYYVHLDKAQKDRALIEQIRQASAEGNSDEAKKLTETLCKFKPSNDVLEHLQKIWTIHAFRHGTTVWTLPLAFHNLSSEKHSADALNLQGSNAIWHGDLDKAETLYEMARERSRTEGNAIAEWVSLEGLRRLEIRSIKDKVKQKALEQKQEVLDLRHLELMRQIDVSNLNEMFERARYNAMEALNEGLQEELLRKSTNSRTRTTKFISFDSLLDTLEDQEYLGFPPDYCGKIVELIASLAFQQGGYSLEVVNLLIRYGSKSLEKLFQSHSLYRQTKSDKEVDQILERLLSEGRTLTEWLAKMSVLRTVVEELPQAHAEQCRRFVDNFEKILRPQPDGTYGLSVNGGTISRSTIWSVQGDIMRIMYRISSYLKDGLNWIISYLESDNPRIREAAIQNLNLIHWDEWTSIGLLELHSSDAEKFCLVLIRVLDSNLDLNDMETMKGVMQALKKFLAACTPNQGIFKKPVFAKLRSKASTLAEEWFSNTSHRARHPWLYRSAMELLQVSDIRKYKSLAKREIGSELKHMKTVKNSSLRAESFGRLASMITSIPTRQVISLLQEALEIITQSSLRDARLVNITDFATKVLRNGKRSLHELALTVLRQTLAIHPDSVLLAAAVSKDKLGDLWSLVDETERERLHGIDRRHGSKDPPPWRTMHSEGFGFDDNWQEAVLAGLKAVSNYAWANSEIPPEEWIDPLWVYVNHPDFYISITALNTLGRLTKWKKDPKWLNQLLNVLKHALSRPNYQIRGEAAFWVGYLSNQGRAFFRLSVAKELSNAIKEDKLAYVLYRWKVGQGQGMLKHSTKK